MMKPTIAATLALVIFFFAFWVVTACMGCTTFKASLPDGTEILYQRLWTESQAKKVDAYYEDPNGVTIWIIINDPNSRVNPGSMIIREPKSGIEAGIETGE
jgi:hypothetical protein